MNNNILPQPKNVNELRELYNKYSAVLTPANKQLIGSILNELEKGENKMDTGAIKNMAEQLNKNANAQNAAAVNNQEKPISERKNEIREERKKKRK